MLFDEASAATPVSDMALVAMGSYGRGAVALRSDADVRLLETLAETLGSAVHAGSSSADARWTITGCEVGRPLAA